VLKASINEKLKSFNEKQKIMKKLIALFLVISSISEVSYTQITQEERNVIIEGIGEVEFEKSEISIDHLHLRGKVLYMIKDSRFDELLEIFNQKGFSTSTKTIYRNEKWSGDKDLKTKEEFLSFIKEIKSTLPNKIKLEPTKIEYDLDLFTGNQYIVELYEYINTKGEKMELFIQFRNGQINIISCRFYLKESF
jgi:hypothetical protein